MKLLIIGGGAAGMSAASKARRIDKTADITVFEQGNYVSYAECGMPYMLAGYFDGLGKLLHYPLSEFTENRNIKVLNGIKVDSIKRDDKYIIADGKRYDYDKLVMATGSYPRIPDEFTGMAYALRTMEDAERLYERLKISDKITIVGAGVLGTELFSLLRHKYKVKLISKHEYLLPFLDEDMGNILNSIAAASASDIEYNSTPQAILKEGNGYSVRTTIGIHSTDTVIFATGVLPSSSLAVDAGLKVDDKKLVLVNEYLQTSDPDIYSAGDSTAAMNIVSKEYGFYPLAQIANKMGRAAGINVYGNSLKFPGVLGTTIINAMGFQVGYTGINEASARRLGYEFDTAFVKAKSKSGYLNGNDVYLKIIFNKKSGRLLGAQIIDKDSGAWRLNTLAAFISAGSSLYDIAYSDLGYEPEYGPVWDPIVIAASLGLDKQDKDK
ncbi:MAG: FAD-dependent oxidoreductase [Ferroplasma sp.]